MITDFARKLLLPLQKELEFYQDGELPLKKLALSIARIREGLSQLRKMVAESGFENDGEEMIFFKREKPGFVAEQVFVQRLTFVQMNRPMYDAAALRQMLNEELAGLRRFFVRNGFLYHYYRMGSSDMDSALFLRGGVPPEGLLPDMPDRDPLFSAPADFMFGRFMAYERLQLYLVSELRKLDQPEAAPLASPGKLKWTGEVINLVEIVYGMWLTGQINHGNATLGEITRWLEEHLQVRIGAPHRRFVEIERRKSLSPTRYIDQMQLAIVRRVDAGFEK